VNDNTKENLESVMVDGSVEKKDGMRVPEMAQACVSHACASSRIDNIPLKFTS